MKPSFLFALFLLAGCAAEQGTPAEVDVSYPSTAASWARRAADLELSSTNAIQRGDTDAALASLAEIAALDAPPTVLAEHRCIVVRDVASRRARLLLTREEAGQALQLLNEAVENCAVADDIFSANLLEQRGAANEALGRARDASRDYEQAMEILERLLEQVLGGTP